MKITTIKTKKIKANMVTLPDLLEEYILDIPEGSILVITSKIVSLSENRIIPINNIDKEQLIKQEADKLLATIGAYGFRFTITNNTLIPAAGIDESNGDGNYVLWPSDTQKIANEIREFLKKKFDLKKFGVIITDSTCTPLRRGTSGICLAHSGFKALNSYIGQKDLFGRDYKVSQSNVAGGLAASAVVVMGEGSESTPICLIEDVSFVQFNNHNPSLEEINEFYINPDEDIFAPFLFSAEWKQGNGGVKF